MSVISAGTRALESVTNWRTGATVSDERYGALEKTATFTRATVSCVESIWVDLVE